jgi:DNA-binding XRE family transcriptional regulator
VAAYRAAGHTTIRAIYRKVRNDAEFYELAIAANSHHGNMLTSYDRQRAIARAEELGITKDRIANLLMVRLETIEHVEKGFGSTADSGAPMPLKFSVRHLKGKQLSARQQKAHETVGGMNQSFYINQVILLLEGNLLDHQSAATVARLYHLKQLLDKYNFKKFELVS